MNKKNIIFSLIIGFFSFAIHGSLPMIYLENQYGAPIAYRTNNSSEQKIANNSRVKLNYPCTMSSINPNCLSTIEIRTTGTGSGYGMSPYHSLDNFIEKINAEFQQHQNHDAILIIHPSSFYSSWNISLRWEKSNNVDAFQMKSLLEELRLEEQFLTFQTANQRINALLQGYLGTEYAQKTSAICNANYKEAVLLGKVNICDNLRRNLVKPEYLVDPERKGIPAITGPTINDIKELIDRLYRGLATYINNGWAQ